LHHSATTLVVQHDETHHRVVPGVGLYHVPEPSRAAGLQPGATVAIDIDGFTLVRSVQTGSAPLPAATTVGGHPLTGTVVRVDPPSITVDHDPIPGVMGAMVMPFRVLPHQAEALGPGDRIRGTLIGSDFGYQLVDPTKIGDGDAALREDIAPLQLGEPLPTTRIPLSDQRSWTVGVDQERPTALTFLYTTCPDPNFCPALAARLQALQPRIAGKARIVAVTIDPEVDSPAVLNRYGRLLDADPDTWVFGRLDPEWLQRLALLSGMAVTERSGRITHNVRLLIFDAEGRLVERYDDNAWPLDRVVSQLLTGEPRPPAGPAGTLSDPEWKEPLP